MSLGFAVLLLGVLFLLVYHAGFRRFMLWSAAALVVAVGIGILVLQQIERHNAAQKLAKQMDAARAACEGGKESEARPPSMPTPAYEYLLQYGGDPCDFIRSHSSR
jgi:hypothetical protein